MLLQLLVMRIEITEFIWENVGIWDKVKVCLAIFLLHADHIIAKAVFSGNFVALREVIDFLVLIQAFIEIALAARRAPQNVPLMRLCVSEPVAFEDRSQKLVVKTQHFEQKLRILNVVRLLPVIATGAEI
jgi:hypothetical protein